MVNACYSTMYRCNLRLIIHQTEIHTISTGDIVSISMVHNYDAKTYPMIRLRLYSDLSLMQAINEYPDEVELRGSFDGAIYRIESSNNPVIVSPTKNISFALKGYIEYKNIPTSKMDQYENGLPKSTEDQLNSNNKVPIELYCYDSNLVHNMKDRTSSIYRDTTVVSVIEDMFSRCNIQKYHMDPIPEITRYRQILVPNASMINALTFFETTYGLYPKGAMLYGDIDQLYLCNLDSNNGTTPIPIYVDSYQNASDMGGMMRTSQGYFMETKFDNVSVISESDIEKVLTSETVTSVNVNTHEIDRATLPFFYEKAEKVRGLSTDVTSGTIAPEIMLHKSPSTYLASARAARLNEKITKVDISGTGFDISKLKPNTRYNIIFESPIRGVKMADSYRASYVCNIITPAGGDLFIAQTTMSLCKN